MARSSGRERASEGLDPRVLGHDVAGDGVVGDLIDGRVAQGRHAGPSGRGFARGTPLGVGAAREPALEPTVDHEQPDRKRAARPAWS